MIPSFIQRSLTLITRTVGKQQIHIVKTVLETKTVHKKVYIEQILKIPLPVVWSARGGRVRACGNLRRPHAPAASHLTENCRQTDALKQQQVFSSLPLPCTADLERQADRQAALGAALELSCGTTCTVRAAAASAEQKTTEKGKGKKLGPSLVCNCLL